ncbi:13691_t:CDS:1, partial [Gigaspora rosea]
GKKRAKIEELFLPFHCSSIFPLIDSIARYITTAKYRQGNITLTAIKPNRERSTVHLSIGTWLQCIFTSCCSRSLFDFLGS